MSVEKTVGHGSFSPHTMFSTLWATNMGVKVKFLPKLSYLKLPSCLCLALTWFSYPNGSLSLILSAFDFLCTYCMGRAVHEKIHY